jgi:hypothetical protein
MANGDVFADVDEVLRDFIHAGRDADGRVDLNKVLEDADAYCDEHPEVMALARRRLLRARLKVVDRGLQLSAKDILQASFLDDADETRYLVVDASVRVDAQQALVTDWDAWYAIHLDDYFRRVAAHQETNDVYRTVRTEWQPGDRLPDVVRRVLARGAGGKRRR